jgi:hypothetical protein
MNMAMPMSSTAVEFTHGCVLFHLAAYLALPCIAGGPSMHHPCTNSSEISPKLQCYWPMPVEHHPPERQVRFAVSCISALEINTLRLVKEIGLNG